MTDVMDELARPALRNFLAYLESLTGKTEATEALVSKVKAQIEHLERESK